MSSSDNCKFCTYHWTCCRCETIGRRVDAKSGEMLAQGELFVKTFEKPVEVKVQVKREKIKTGWERGPFGF